MNGKLMRRLGNSIVPAARQRLADLIFPKTCLHCGRSGSWLCDSCSPLVMPRTMEICPACKQETNQVCCNDSALAGLFVLNSYRQPLVDDLIKQFKYGYAADLVEAVFADWLNDFISAYGDILPADLVLAPIPLHRRKLLERGFNQAELLAAYLAAQTSWSLAADLLLRVRYNQQQARLSGERRLANVRGIFRLNERKLSDNWGRTVLLVDDVYTTGSTMKEAAEILKKAGFLNIYGLALAVN